MKQRWCLGVKLCNVGLASSLLLLYWLVRRKPLRPSFEDAAVHDGRNLAVAALGAITVQLVEFPVRTARSYRRATSPGAVARLRAPHRVRTVATLVLLD